MIPKSPLSTPADPAQETENRRLRQLVWGIVAVLTTVPAGAAILHGDSLPERAAAAGKGFLGALGGVAIAVGVIIPLFPKLTQALGLPTNADEREKTITERAGTWAFFATYTTAMVMSLINIHDMGTYLIIMAIGMLTYYGMQAYLSRRS